MFQHYPIEGKRGGQFPFLAVAGISQLDLLVVKQQGSGLGGWEGDAKGSQALPTKPLRKVIILRRERYPLFPFHLRPKATGVLLTSHQRRLMTDSSDGSEHARGLGCEPQCAAGQPGSPTRLPSLGSQDPGPQGGPASVKSQVKLEMASGYQGDCPVPRG